MTLLFQKRNFGGNFITFLEVSKLLITNWFLNVTYRQGADHKKVFAVETMRCVSVRNGLCRDDVAVLALSRSNTWLAAYVRFPTNQNSFLSENDAWSCQWMHTAQ